MLDISVYMGILWDPIWVIFSAPSPTGKHQAAGNFIGFLGRSSSQFTLIIGVVYVGGPKFQGLFGASVRNVCFFFLDVERWWFKSPGCLGFYRGFTVGGFKYFLFSPLFWEDSHFDCNIFQRVLKPPTRCFFDGKLTVIQYKHPPWK